MTDFQIFLLGIACGVIAFMAARGTRRRGLSFVQPPMIGAVFVYFDCRGCMAQDHRFMWIGVGDHFTNSSYDAGGTEIEIRILKRAGDPDDSRDTDKGFENFFVGDGSIQNVAPGLYLIFK